VGQAPQVPLLAFGVVIASVWRLILITFPWVHSE
jgi:hypothetical protein